MELNNWILILVVVIAVVFFVLVMPSIDSTKIKENLADIAAKYNPMVKIDKNLCSRDCCKHVQWPVAHDKKSIDTKDYIGSNMSCNFGSGSGCVCVTKNDFDYLSTRGNNTGKC